MAAAAWKGALELAGFPVNVRLHSRVKSRAGESFKTLAPNGQPVRSVYMDTDGNEVERSETSKGVEVEKGQWTALSPEAVESITSMEKSTTVTASSFAPVESLPRELAVGTYVVIPDKDVAGAEKSVNLIWNGLRATGLAYLTQVTMRAGSRDAILAIYAEDEGLYAITLPFAEEMADVPAPAYEEDEKAAEMFGRFVDSDQVEAFDQSAYTSEYRERRKAAVEAALSGKAPKATPKKAAAKAEADLLAALEDAVAKKPKKAAAKKATPKKKAAKVPA